jgi:hypothetical protein
MRPSVRWFLAALAGACIWCLPRVAAALVLQAPAGGAWVTLPDGRVICNGPAGWSVDNARRRIRAHATAGLIGRAVDASLAPSLAACGTSAAEKTTLIATGPLPAIDPQSVMLSVDAGRLELQGEELDGVRIEWTAGDVTGSETCLKVTQDKGRSVCALPVGKDLPADSSRALFRWAPPGGRTGDGVVTHDRLGNALSSDQTRVPVARVLITHVFSQTRTVDISRGSGNVALAHPESVGSVACGSARCDLSKSGIVVSEVPANAASLTLRIRLLPRVFLVRGEALENTPTETLSIVRCPLSVASGPPLRNADDTHVLLRLDPMCGRDADQLTWTANGAPAAVMRAETLDDGTYVLLRVGQVVGDPLTIVASRPEERSVLAVTSERTWEAPPVRTSLLLPGFGEIEFIPKNRDALLSVTALPGSGRLVPVSIPGAYLATTSDGVFRIRGVYSSGGYTALRLAYRLDSVPREFRETDFARLVDPVQRPIREANIPAPIGGSSLTKEPIVELQCAFGPGQLRTIEPGSAPHIPFAQRDSCRVIIYRERIPEESGEQRLDLDVRVTTAGDMDRGEAALSPHLVLRHGPGREVIWIRGVMQQFDRISVRVSHVIDESQYLSSRAARSSLPSSQWAVVVEDARFRFYATAAIPASLYRFSRDPQNLGTGPLALNFGVLSRLTWLNREGKEGLVGVETGVMGMGLATELDRQLAIVAGLGISIPLGNANQPTQAAVGVHAWAAYSIGTRLRELKTLDGQSAGTIELNPWAFIFGPSITIGSVGTFL